MTKEKSMIRKFFVTLSVASMMIASFKVTASANGTANFSLNRLSGRDRYETSAQVSRFGWSGNCSNVVLATGDDFPDSLCAAPLAAKLNAPIILTNTKSLNINAKNEIVRLKPQKVYIVGGPGAVSNNAENEIKNMGISVDRIYGADRYETSLEIAKRIGSTNEVFIATGADYPDALSAASVAAKDNASIILSYKDGISENAKKFLQGQSIGKSYILGGPYILSNTVFDELPNCTRIFGKDRYETNIKFINNFYDKFNFNEAFMARGDDFPDALSCASLAGLKCSPIILNSSSYNKSTNLFFKSMNSFIKSVNVIGGSAVLPDKYIFRETEGPNAENYIKMPTYDNRGQACHPKVLYFADGWNGFKYWMAMTPYPDDNDQIENPSIVVSNSGVNWEVPKGLKNPLTPAPDKEGIHYSDPHLVYNKDKNELELWYRYTYFDQQDIIYRRTSTDGVNWTAPQQMLVINGTPEKSKFCLSPSVLYEDNKYKMWYVDENFDCQYIESSDGTKWSNPVKVNFNFPDSSYGPWHIDIVHTDKGYEALVSADNKENIRTNNLKLFWSVSNDGLNFKNTKVIIKSTNGKCSWDNKQIYRSTFVKVDGMYKLFYSAMNTNYKWHIGFTQGYDIDNLCGYNGDI